jgi:hypothetical protein
MLEFDDIQYILLTRVPALTGRYEFLSFQQPAQGRAWLDAIREKVPSCTFECRGCGVSHFEEHEPAKPSGLIRRTQRFGTLPDVSTLEYQEWGHQANSHVFNSVYGHARDLGVLSDRAGPVQSVPHARQPYRFSTTIRSYRFCLPEAARPI